MPNQPKTQHRSVRVDDELWNAALRASKANGETVADVVRRALTEYVDGYQRTDANESTATDS